MTRMLSALTLLLLFAVLCFSPAYAAEEKKQDKPAPVLNQPAKVDALVTVVSVEHTGVDSLGARLSMRMKELFNSSSLFRLANGNEAKMQLLIATKEEFPSRPAIGSVYEVIWTYSQGENYLPMLLGSEVGVVSSDTLDALIAKLIERTDGLSVKYAYLLKAKK